MSGRVGQWGCGELVCEWSGCELVEIGVGVTSEHLWQVGEWVCGCAGVGEWVREWVSWVGLGGAATARGKHNTTLSMWGIQFQIQIQSCRMFWRVDHVHDVPGLKLLWAVGLRGAEAIVLAAQVLGAMAGPHGLPSRRLHGLTTLLMSSSGCAQRIPARGHARC